MTRLLYSAQFNTTAMTVRPEVAEGLAAAVRYLIEHGRAAVGPDVEWHLRTSVYGRNSGEIRWPDPEHQSAHPGDAWRALFVAATDTSWVLLTVLGNKAVGPDTGNDWYRVAVPLSDRIAEHHIDSLNLDQQPPRT